MKQALREDWIDRIFARLIGIYGAQFRSKFSSIENGVDVGMLNAKAAWADELGSFATWPEAIAYALDHLPTERAPNALEFRDICRRAPKKSEAVAAVEYKPTVEDTIRHREMAHAATQALKPKISDGIDKHWATHPRSEMQLRFIFDAAKRDARFAPCIAEMIKDGICTAAGQLLKIYRDGALVKA
jgi:hypothetical protein